MPRPVPRLRSLAPALAVAVATLLLPSFAGAATTVTKVGGVITVTGDDAASFLRSETYFMYFGLQDEVPGATVTAGPGCQQAEPFVVECGEFAPGDRIVVNLGGGDDDYKYATIDPSQTVNGEGGNDIIETGNGADVVNGGVGNDDLTGGRGDDTLDGAEGNDKVDGWDGSDSVTGGPGVDQLLGDGGTIYSGGGDKIFARDGEADAVDCGGGADVAELDTADTVSACATVNRAAAPGPGPSTGQNPGGTTPAPETGKQPGPGSANTTKLDVVAVLTKPQGLRALADGKKLSVSVLASAACTNQVTLRVSKGEAKKRGLGRTDLQLGASSAKQLTTKPEVVKVGVSAAFRKKLRKVAKLKVEIVIGCTDAADRVFLGTLKATLKK